MTVFAFEFGSTDSHRFGINPVLLNEQNRDDLWDEIEKHATTGVLSGLLLHRLMGEFRPGDLFDFDALYQIAQSGDPVFVNYARHMAQRVLRFAGLFPKLPIYIYMSALNHSRMRGLLEEHDFDEWNRRVEYELALPRMLLQLGSNTHIVFDHSAAYQPYRVNEQGEDVLGYEVEAVLQLSAQYPKRIIAESIPDPEHPLADLPSLAIERRFIYLDEHRPVWVAEARHITRLCNGHDERDPIEFVLECERRGHTPIVSARKLERLRISIPDFVQQVNASRRPQEVA